MCWIKRLAHVLIEWYVGSVLHSQWMTKPKQFSIVSLHHWMCSFQFNSFIYYFKVYKGTIKKFLCHPAICLVIKRLQFEIMHVWLCSKDHPAQCRLAKLFKFEILREFVTKFLTLLALRMICGFRGKFSCIWPWTSQRTDNFFLFWSDEQINTRTLNCFSSRSVVWDQIYWFNKICLFFLMCALLLFTFFCSLNKRFPNFCV